MSSRPKWSEFYQTTGRVNVDLFVKSSTGVTVVFKERSVSVRGKQSGMYCN